MHNHQNIFDIVTTSLVVAPRSSYYPPSINSRKQHSVPRNSDSKKQPLVLRTPMQESSGIRVFHHARARCLRGPVARYQSGARTGRSPANHKPGNGSCRRSHDPAANSVQGPASEKMRLPGDACACVGYHLVYKECCFLK